LGKNVEKKRMGEITAKKKTAIKMTFLRGLQKP